MGRYANGAIMKNIIRTSVIYESCKLNDSVCFFSHFLFLTDSNDIIVLLLPEHNDLPKLAV